ncbi:MAG TPA: hypothetical protein VIV11_25285 [Kofleriaceae bacterium]
MSMRRAAPGPQLSSGRIRVDAGKAIAKLREYQLADRTAWVLEAIRAAVAAKATRIELRADTNDVWLSWEGEPWRDEVLPRLFDELVSPAPASENHHVRLLAAAVNSALGMGPVHVDVVAIHEAGAMRVRYTPAILVEPESQLGESALRHVAPEPIERPEHLEPGMLVHLRRRLTDWKVFSAIPELARAREACDDIPVPLHLGDDVLHRDASHDVLRVPLGEGLDGFIAVTDLRFAAAAGLLQVAERGVVLAEYGLALLEAKHGLLPLRVYIDAPRMPTNASRSQVRRDAFPIAAAEQRAQKLLERVIAELAAITPTNPHARASALRMIAAVVGGDHGTSNWHVDVPSLRGPLRELTKLPLVRNAVGKPRPLTSHWRAEVHTGGKPFDEELAPWLDDVLWAPAGDPATQLVEGAAIDVRGMRRLARWARRQQRAHKKFYAHTQREVKVLAAATPHVRAPLGLVVEGSAVPQQLFEQLQGEVCIYTEGTVGALAILLEGRTLDRVEFDSPLSFDVVIDSPNVTPGDRYRGVKRDAAYKRVERAMRGGLARALEAHALAKRDPDHAEIDGKLFRKGFGVLTELGVPVRGPLAKAPAYPNRDGTWMSLADLAKQPVIGVVAPNRPGVAVPANRPILALSEPDRIALAQQVPGRIVPYRKFGTTNVAQTLIASLVMQGGGSFVVREAGVVAALTPSSKGQLRLFHTGVELDERDYRGRWLPCTIAIDCDAIVPDDNWTRVVDDGGLGSRNYAEWELALVRALAWAVIGKPPPELITGTRVELDSRLGSALCDAIRMHDPTQLLGASLLAMLRAAPLVRLLGVAGRVSVDHVAELFDSGLPYIESELLPVEDFTPVIASKEVAATLAKLAGRTAVAAAHTVERFRRKALRRRKLEAHRLRAVQPLTVPAEYIAPVAGSIARGVVGLKTSGVLAGMFEIRVAVESRSFTVIMPSLSELPLIAAVEIPEAHCDDTFGSISDETRRAIDADVRAAIPQLLAEIAKRSPQLLGDAHPARTLLAAVKVGDEHVLKLLRAAPAFHTLQGRRVSLDQAAHPRLIISVASWVGDWLGPDQGEPPHQLDEPILFVPDALHDVSSILDKLHRGAVIDVTNEVVRLQARRRVARGLVPSPKARSALPQLKRSLASLGTFGKQLGIGEIGLVDAPSSMVTLYEGGVQKRTEAVDVMPSIDLAVELAEPVSFNEVVQQLATALVKEVLAAVQPDLLPIGVQRNLFRAALARKLDRDVLLPLHRWRDFLDQIDQHGDVWIVTQPTDLLPLDDTRKVLYFERSTYDLALQHNWDVVDAEKELTLDQVARSNRARRPAVSLDLPWREGVLAEVTLDGNGVTAPRGRLAVMAPSAAHWRGVWPHMKMHPFDKAEDPCRWPTMAVIDDARLVPDRTWSLPQKNDEWQEVAKALRIASEQALTKVGEAPEDALASLRINNHACADVSALRKAPKSLIRGLLWLTGDPRRDLGIRVTDQDRTRTFTSAHELAIGGKLFGFAPDGLDIDLALQQLCWQAHGKLVRQLMKAEHPDPDLVAAHVAHALFVQTLRPTDARGIEFPCFSRPLDARALSSLFKREGDVIVIKPDAARDPDPDAIELVDDGSTLANTIIADLGDRVHRPRAAPKPRPARERPPTQPPPPPVAKPKPKPQPPAPPHPLDGLVAKLRSRLADLGIGGYGWRIVDLAEPMFAYGYEIEVAGDNVRLRALAAALLANSPFAAAGLDVVIAHLVTVLNVSLTQITDAHEAHALGMLLVTPRSAGPPRSRQSS